MGVVRENMVNMNKFSAANAMEMGNYSVNRQGASFNADYSNKVDAMSSLQGVDLNNFTWREQGTKRIGEGKDNNDNLIEITQKRGTDGEWYNESVKTVHGNGVTIKGGRGEDINLDAGATSTQYSNGTIDYNGTNDKFGKVDARYGADGQLAMMKTEKGHEYFNKHNSIDQDLYMKTVNVSNDYTGDVLINGQQGWGRLVYSKDKSQASFSGQIGNKEVSMILDGVKDFNITNQGEHNSLASLNGDVGKLSINKSQTENYDNIYSAKKVQDTSNMTKADTLTSNTNTVAGIINFNGEKIYGKVEYAAGEDGLVGKVTGTNSKGEKVDYSFSEGALKTDGKTHNITGTVGQSDVNALKRNISGNSNEVHLNTNTVTGGSNVQGLNGSPAMLNAGLYQFTHNQNGAVNQGMSNAFIVNEAERLASLYGGQTRSMTVGEAQARAQRASIEAGFSAGIGLPLKIINIGGSVKGSKGETDSNELKQSTDINTSENLNVYAVRKTFENLEQDKLGGKFNDKNGQLDINAYNAEAVLRFATLEKELSDFHKNIQNPNISPEAQEKFQELKAKNDPVQRTEDALTRAKNFSGNDF